MTDLKKGTKKAMEPQTFLKLGDEHSAKEKMNRAIACYNIAINLDPKSAAASESRDRLKDIEFRLRASIPRAILEKHTSTVDVLEFSPDGKTLASGCTSEGEKKPDKTVRLWDVASGREKFVLVGSPSGITGVAFRSDSQVLAAGCASDSDTSEESAVRSWDVATGKPYGKWASCRGIEQDTLAFSPNGKKLAGGYGTTLLLFAATGKNFQFTKTELKGHSGTIASLAFSPDGKLIATGSHDKTVRLWDVATGKEHVVLKKHDSSICSLAFSPDGTTLATVGLKDTIRIWDIATGKEKIVLSEVAKSTGMVAFSPNGKCLATAYSDDTARLWDLASNRKSVGRFED